MNRVSRIAVVSVLLCAVVALPIFGATRTRAVSPPSPAAIAATAKLLKTYSTADLQAGVYVGSNFCVACHKGMSSQLATNHSSFVRRPLPQLTLQPGKGVIANSLGKGTDDFISGLDFNAVSGTVFDKYKPNAPKLSVENGAYFITIGSLKMPVVLTVAGQPTGSAQRFGVRVPVSDSPTGFSQSIYYAPFAYDPKSGYTYSSGWYDTTTNAPKFSSGVSSASLVASGGPSNHTSGCTGCHMGGATKSLAKTASGETTFQGYTAILFSADDPTVLDYNNDGNFELANIGCESCHGPGSNHILGGGDPTRIVNPANLKPTAQSEICGRCHVNGKSTPTGTYNWPMNDATQTQWTPFDAKAGTPLANFYTDTAKVWPGGILNGARQLNAWKTAAHGTFTAHQVGCPDCHDAHVEGEGMLIRESSLQGTLNIKTSAEDNTLCISCHATHGPFAGFTKQDVFDASNSGKADAQAKIATVTEAHTHHPYAPERTMGLSRCTGCHMSAFSHTWQVGSPTDTLKFADKGGQPNGCASGCHNNKVEVAGIGQTKAPADSSKWNTAYDTTLNNFLKAYYGDKGKWWDTSK